MVYTRTVRFVLQITLFFLARPTRDEHVLVNDTLNWLTVEAVKHATYRVSDPSYSALSP